MDVSSLSKGPRRLPQVNKRHLNVDYLKAGPSSCPGEFLNFPRAEGFQPENLTVLISKGACGDQVLELRAPVPFSGLTYFDLFDVF